MIQYIIAYISTVVVFFAIDLVWLGFVAKDFYQKHLGPLLLDSFNIPVAIVFYLLYIVGIVLFAINPALASGSWKTALLLGAAFGFFCYATYDLTNMAMLKNWSMTVVIVDIIWGTVLTGSAALGGYLITRLFI